MREPLEDEYFKWLCAKVLDPYSRMYHDLLQILHRTEFVWVVPADSHRALDGKELRRDFGRETFTKIDPLWFEEPTSIFEVFLSLAQRASFQTSSPVKDWFWEFMTNLQLDQFRQISNDEDVRAIEEVLYIFVWRLYDQDGNGGIFPLRQTNNDQREVELWYQFSDYVNEQGRV